MIRLTLAVGGKFLIYSVPNNYASSGAGGFSIDATSGASYDVDADVCFVCGVGQNRLQPCVI